MARNVPREGNPLKDKSITQCNFSMQPGEFTLPGRLRALPRRQSHSIIKWSCSSPLHKSSGSGIYCNTRSLGSAMPGPLQTQNEMAAAGMRYGKTPSRQTYLCPAAFQLPSCAAAAAAWLLSAAVAALANAPGSYRVRGVQIQSVS